MKDDKVVAQSLQAKYEQMTKEQNNIRAMLEARLKHSESGDKNLINKLVAEASQKAFERYKSEIAKHIDVIYERIRPKIEETCVNLGFQKPSPKMDSPREVLLGAQSTKKRWRIQQQEEQEQNRVPITSQRKMVKMVAKNRTTTRVTKRVNSRGMRKPSHRVNLNHMSEVDDKPILFHF